MTPTIASAQNIRSYLVQLAEALSNTFPANVFGQVYISLEDEDGDGVKEASVQLSETLSVTYQLTNDAITLEKMEATVPSEHWMISLGGLAVISTNSSSDLSQ